MGPNADIDVKEAKNMANNTLDVEQIDDDRGDDGDDDDDDDDDDDEVDWEDGDQTEGADASSNNVVGISDENVSFSIELDEDERVGLKLLKKDEIINVDDDDDEKDKDKDKNNI